MNTKHFRKNRLLQGRRPLFIGGAALLLLIVASIGLFVLPRVGTHTVPTPTVPAIYLTAQADPTVDFFQFSFEAGTYRLDTPIQARAPADGAVLEELRPRLEVVPVPGAAGYEFEIDISPTFDSVLRQDSFNFFNSRVYVAFTSPQWTPPVNLHLSTDLLAPDARGALDQAQIYDLVLRLIDGSTSDMEEVTRLYAFVAYQIEIDSDTILLPGDFVLAQLKAECANQMEALGYMSYLLGYPVRKISMKALDAWSDAGYPGAGHATMEIFVDGQWRLVDPYVRFMSSDSLLEMVDHPPEDGWITYGRAGLPDLTYPRMVSQTGYIVYVSNLITLSVLDPERYVLYNFGFDSYRDITGLYDEAHLADVLAQYAAQPEQWTVEDQQMFQRDYGALWRPRQIPQPDRREAFSQTLYWRVRAVMNPDAVVINGVYDVEPEDLTPWSEVYSFTIQTTIPVLDR